jgi:release factor family 11
VFPSAPGREAARRPAAAWDPDETRIGRLVEGGSDVNLHVDIPTRAQLEALLTSRNPSSVSLYVATDPTSQADAERIELKNLLTGAVRQLESAAAAKSDVAEIDAAVTEVIEDDTFWRYQARSLALFVTPATLTTFRLPNRLVSLVEVSDRFHLKPLLRAVTFPQAAFVLALAQNSVRLLEVMPDLPPSAVGVPDLPTDAADAVGVSSIKDRAPRGRIQGSEGQKVRLRQYARAVDQSLRPLLNGLDIPLILAATEPLDGIFRSVNSYPHLAPNSLAGNPEATSDADLVAGARTVLDELHVNELEAIHELFGRRASEGRAVTDIAEAARAATYGAVDTMLVDIDEVVPGSVDEVTGAVSFGAADDAVDYGVVDELARRVLLNGGRVLAVRRDDVPGKGSLAAILRYRL